MTATLRAVFQPLVEGRATLEQTRREMVVRTPRLFADRTRCPLLLAAGEWDDIYARAVALDAALVRAAKAHEFVLFPGMGHAIQSRSPAPGSRTPRDVTFEFLWRHARPRD